MSSKKSSDSENHDNHVDEPIETIISGSNQRAKPKISKIVLDALHTSNGRKGISFQMIKQYLSLHYSESNVKIFFVKKFIKKLLEDGTVIQTTGHGFNGSFKLANVKKTKKTEIKSANKEDAKSRQAGPNVVMLKKNMDSKTSSKMKIAKKKSETKSSKKETTVKKKAVTSREEDKTKSDAKIKSKKMGKKSEENKEKKAISKKLPKK